MDTYVLVEHHYASLFHHIYTVPATSHSPVSQDWTAGILVDHHPRLGCSHDRLRVCSELDTFDRPSNHSWHIRGGPRKRLLCLRTYAEIDVSLGRILPWSSVLTLYMVHKIRSRQALCSFLPYRLCGRSVRRHPCVWLDADGGCCWLRWLAVDFHHRRHRR